jgi:hypothetical protein
VFDVKESGGVMHRTVAVVVIANRTVEKMIAEDTVKSLALRRIRACRACNYLHTVRSEGAARSYELSIYFDHAGIAGLDRSKLRVIADLRNLDTATIDCIDQVLTGPDRLRLAVNRDCHARVHPSGLIVDVSR